MQRRVGKRTIEKDARRLRVLMGGTTTTSAGSHEILSSTHSDALTATVVDGDVVVGNVTPKWSRLAISIPAANVHNYLGVDNAELRPSWKSGNSNPGAASAILASDASGYLQLTGLGIGAAPASDDLHIATGQGVTHADGVADGMFLRANGTRYVPDTLDVDDITDLAYAVPNLTLTTANAAGAANTVIRSDASILVYDVTVPTSLAPDDAAATGAAATAARRDHGHGIPCAAPTINLSVSTTNAEGAGSNFVRDSHTHAIDSSSNPGAAASILASDASSFVPGQVLAVDGGWLGRHQSRAEPVAVQGMGPLPTKASLGRHLRTADGQWDRMWITMWKSPLHSGKGCAAGSRPDVYRGGSWVG